MYDLTMSVYEVVYKKKLVMTPFFLVMAFLKEVKAYLYCQYEDITMSL